MATHGLELEQRVLHGYFGGERAPLLTVSPGDTVRFRTAAGWRYHRRMTPDAPPEFERDPSRDGGHALSGPIAVSGAEPGQVLVVKIGTLRPAPWGVTIASVRDPRYPRLGITRGDWLQWDIDADAGTAVNQLGHKVRLRPFMGVMGNAPAEPGFHPTAPPRNCGGNMDCRELVTGATLYLPIEVPGAMFSVGDGHGAQGDGEVAGTAIECPMEVCDLTFDLRSDLKIGTPHAETPAGYVTMGFSTDLDEAMLTALNEMLDILQARTGASREHTIGLASVIVDLHVTQMVNGVQGVHAILPHDALLS